MGTKNNPNETSLIQSLSQLIDSAKHKGELSKQINTKDIAELLFAINTMYIVYWLNGAIKSRKECLTKINSSVKILFNSAVTNQD